MSKIFSSAELDTYMVGVTLNAGLRDQVVAAVNEWIENRTHRCFGEIKTITDENHGWSNSVWLDHMDVVSITSMSLGWPGQSQTTVQSSAYFFNRQGRVTCFSNANQNISRLYNDYMHVTYTYGYDRLGYAADGVTPIVPDDLKLAALSIAAGLYNYAANGNQQVVAAAVGSYRLQYIGSVRGTSSGALNPAGNISESHWATVDSYVMKRA